MYAQAVLLTGVRHYCYHSRCNWDASCSL